MKRQNSKKQLPIATEAIRLDPQMDVAYMNRGRSYNGMGDYNKAILDLTEAVRLNPQNAKAYCNRGR